MKEKNTLDECCGWRRIGRRLEWEFYSRDERHSARIKLKKDSWWHLRYEIYRENGGAEPRLLKGGFSTRQKRAEIEELMRGKMKEISDEYLFTGTE